MVRGRSVEEQLKPFRGMALAARLTKVFMEGHRLHLLFGAIDPVKEIGQTCGWTSS